MTSRSARTIRRGARFGTWRTRRTPADGTRGDEAQGTGAGERQSVSEAWHAGRQEYLVDSGILPGAGRQGRGQAGKAARLATTRDQTDLRQPGGDAAGDLVVWAEEREDDAGGVFAVAAFGRSGNEAKLAIVQFGAKPGTGGSVVSPGGEDCPAVAGSECGSRHSREREATLRAGDWHGVSRAFGRSVDRLWAVAGVHRS